MMSKTPRWQDTLVNSKANKVMQKKKGKDSKLPSGKQSASTRSGGTVVGRRHSLDTRDLNSGGKGGGSKQEQSHAGLKDTRTASRSSKPGIRLSSSQNFSSLHGSSFPDVPFIRSSCSLNRLDQSGSDEKSLDFRKCSTSLETLRDTKDFPAKKTGDMKNSLSDQTIASSSVATCHQQSNKVKKQTRDGVYTLCAMTSGLRAVLRNVRPSATPALNSRVEQSGRQQRSKSLDKKYDGYTEDRDKANQNSLELLKEQKQVKQSNADSTTVASILPPPISPSISSATPPFNSPPDQEKTQLSSDALVHNAENGIPDDASLNGDLNALLKHNTESATASEEDGQQSINNSFSLCAQEENSGKHTGQLVKELKKTQKELSRLQQINKTLQDELQQQKERHLKEMSFGQSDSISTAASSLDRVTFLHLQKTNQDLRAELEAQRRSQEEAREDELCRRVDLLAQKAHLLVSGDATTLAQTQLELDRWHFKEKQLELEQIIASLKSELQLSEEKRAEAETRLTEVQQEMQGLCQLEKEANQLRENYQEVRTQLHAYEDTQTQKEARLEQHLMLLQASQERERKNLVASLAQAERRSQDLQEQLKQAEEEVENLNKSQEWTKEIQEAQEQLQEELQQTISAMEELQEEKDHLEQQCQNLQSQVHELTGEVSRLQDRLKTDETQFYNLEHSYERVCEELQVATGKVRQWETETQEMREGYERQLDLKEQELIEVLLKMEVLGNSLEETEMQLNEELKNKDKEKKHFIDNTQNVNVDGSMKLHSKDQSPVPDGEDLERFASTIQVLETKLYVTEEKLKDITQRLEDYQSHASCQDPLLCSQLTQTRANAQHLGLLLHTQAKNNQRFAQHMENRCRMLVGRFQVSLNIIQACRGRLQEAESLTDVEDFEKQLATLVNCLKQGEKDAEKQQHESRYAIREEERILNDKMLTESVHLMEDASECVGKSLAREIFVVETMATLLQSKNVFGQLKVIQKENEDSVSQSYQNLLTQIIAVKAQSRNDDLLEEAVSSACVEAELFYRVFKLQQQNPILEEIQTSELESNAENEDKQDKPMHRQTKENDDTKFDIWVENLVSTLQKTSAFLRQLSQDISQTITHENTDLKWVNEQAKIIYLTHRLYLDLKHESVNKVQAICSEQQVTETVCHLEEINCALREELEQAEERVHMVEMGNQKLLEDIQKIESHHVERMEKLENEFQDKIQELQRIHEEEMKHLHDYYSKSCFSKEKLNKMMAKSVSSPSHNGTESNTEELDKSERVSALEDMHKKLISDLQQQHQKEVATLLKEKDQLLKDETTATMAAIVAMRRAHKEELEKTRRATNIRENADMSKLHIEYEKELQTLNKDLEVLSVQHTQKCLENSLLSQELQQERKTLMQYQMENQELKKKQKAEDISSLHSFNGKHLTPEGLDTHEMEIILRTREVEMQFLRQEAQSLKEELKLARLDTIYAQNKLKSLCMGTPDEKLYEDLKWATWSPGRQGQSQMFSEEAGTNQYDKNVNSGQFRTVRSKSLKEGLSVQEWMKLFYS